MAASTQPSQELIEEFVGVAHGDAGRVKELLEQYPALLNARASWGESAIEAAAHTGQREIAEYLLAQGAPLDICTAAMLGMDERVVAWLRDDPSQARATGAHGIPLFYYVAISGNIPLADTVEEYGVEITAGERAMTALHGAALFGQVEMADWLMQNGADFNAPDYEGKMAIDRAIESGHDEVADVIGRYVGLS